MAVRQTSESLASDWLVRYATSEMRCHFLHDADTVNSLLKLA